MKSILHGKTPQQLIDQRNAVLAERKVKEQEQSKKEIEDIKQELAELNQKKSIAEKSKEVLKQFIVVKSRFYYKENKYTGKEPIIELTVKNETKYPISRTYFEGILASPKRSVPWLKEDFNYQISGGIEPGEELTWSLAPNSFGSWGRAPKDRDDMILTVTPTDLDGADGKTLLKEKFSKYDQEELERLENRLAALQK